MFWDEKAGIFTVKRNAAYWLEQSETVLEGLSAKIFNILYNLPYITKNTLL
jgi:hypothetical protein